MTETAKSKSADNPSEAHTVDSISSAKYLSQYKSFFSNIPGILFFILHAWYSYVLYHVNSYKLLILGLSVSLLWVLAFFTKNKREADVNAFKLLGLLALPVLLTIPGMLMFKMHYNYYLPIEFASKVFLILWSYYLFLNIFRNESLEAFIFWIRITILYVALYAVLEKFSLNPLESGSFLSGAIVNRAKSTFGNVNYFAGFLVTVVPILIVPFIADIFSNRSNVKGFDLVKGKRQTIAHFFKSLIYSIQKNKFIAFSIVITVLALYYTETRAAQGGFLISMTICTILFILSQLNRKHRIYFYIFSLVGISALLSALLYAITHYDELAEIFGHGNRYLMLLTAEGWYTRLGSWYVAWLSILKSPFFGYGLGSSYTLFFDYVMPEIDLYHDEKSFNHVHNEHLEYMQEAGFIGFIVLVCVIGYFCVQLFKIAINKQISIKPRFYAFSCVCGILAFYLHGIFSVAQRMIVANIGVYSIFGIGFYLIVKYGKPVSGRFLFLKFNPIAIVSTWLTKKLPQKPLVIYVVVFLPLIASAWFVFYSWCTPILLKNEYAKAGGTVIDFLKYSEKARKDPSVYTIYDNMIQEMNLNRYSDAAKTGRVILEEIPHYRNTETLVAKAELINGNEAEALKYLELSSLHNDYTPEKNFLQILIALKLNNPEMFYSAVEKLYVRQTMRQYYKINNFKAITLERAPTGSTELFSMSLERNGEAIDYHHTDNVCDVTEKNITGIKFQLNPIFYEALLDITNSPKNMINTKVNNLYSYIYQAINQKQTNFRLQSCSKLSEEDKKKYLTMIQNIESNKNQIHVLQTQIKNNPANEKELKDNHDIQLKINGLNSSISRLKLDVKGKNNYLLYEKEIQLAQFLISILGSINFNQI